MSEFDKKEMMRRIYVNIGNVCFARSTSLIKKSHVAKKNLAPEINYMQVCEACGSFFANADILEKHEQINLGQGRTEGDLSFEEMKKGRPVPLAPGFPLDSEINSSPATDNLVTHQEIGQPEIFTEDQDKPKELTFAEKLAAKKAAADAGKKA